MPNIFEAAMDAHRAAVEDIQRAAPGWPQAAQVVDHAHLMDALHREAEAADRLMILFRAAVSGLSQ